MSKKKHHAEEHVNLEAWVISYADMVTLLLALFVVLYAIGEVKLSKLKELKESMAFAFSFEGSGKTEKPGIHERGEEGRGQVISGVPILNAQSAEMKRFISETLPDNFKEATGSSLEIVQKDDTISFVAPLTAYFEQGKASPLRSNELSRVLVDLVTNAHSFASSVRVRIDSPSVVIGRDENGLYLRSAHLCLQRLGFLQEFIATLPNVEHSQILCEFQYDDGPVYPPGSRATVGWEDRARLTVAFSNSTQDPAPASGR